MREVYIVGSHSTSFGKKPETSFKDLTRETYTGVLADIGLERGDDLDFIYFGNCAMHGVKQGTIRGQACTIELVDDGLIPRRTPLINVEGGCATGSMAIHSAFKDIRSGASDLVLAIGVEKLFIPKAATDPAYKKKMMKGFLNGVDNFDLPRLFAEYEAAAKHAGINFGTGEDRSFFMDTYAVQAALHMREYGTTQRQIGAAAAQSHNYGALNPLAQYRFPMTTEAVLADREISYPFTRAMCAPIGDGAAAALLCSEDTLAAMPTAVQVRAVRLAASVLTGGYYRAIDEPSLSRVAADRAYAAAGLGPGDVDVLEVHDASSFSVLYQLEMLRFAEPGGGGPLVESGATGPGGSIPTNTSGGLVSKGHPVGATGISMVHELVVQLRGEAGERQVPGARVAMQENGGGVIGLEEAACSVMLLEKA
ncbi:MAG: thiolase family protein [Sporichthyaceae bacterium]